MNPRNTRTVALTKPTETERGQLYFQRYAVHLPTAGEVVLSTAPGIIAPVSSASWAFAPRISSQRFCGRRRIRRTARPRRHQALQVLSADRPRDAVEALLRAASGPAEAMEAVERRSRGALEIWPIYQGEIEMFRFTSTYGCAVARFRADLTQRRARLVSVMPAGGRL